MVTKLSVRDKNISVQLVEHVVRITTDDQLTGLLQHKTKAATEELVIRIKTEYKSLYNTPLKIVNGSIVVEIWGHVYADQFAKWMKKISAFGIVNKVANFVIYHAEVIDIGERKYDNNRFVWDALALFKPAIALFLPK